MTVVVLALFVGGKAAAYCLFSPPGSSLFYSWKSMPVSYQVSDNLTDPQLLQAIDAAFQTWEDVACSTLAFSKEGPFTMCAQPPCAPNTVEVQHSNNRIYVFWFTNPTGFPGTAQNLVDFYTYSDLNGEILGASIAINAFSNQWDATGGSYYQKIYDLQNEMTAFVGSVIGLTESAVPGSTMYPPVTGGDTAKRSLEQDDIDGVVYIYKAPGCADPPAPGPDGCYTPPQPPDAGATQQDGGADANVADASGGDLSSADTLPAGDASVADDAQTGGQDSTAGQGDGGLDDASSAGDAGQPGQTDDGCCRASHGREAGVFWIVVLGVGVLLTLRRRRTGHTGSK